MRTPQRGQAMVLVAVALMGITAMGMLLVVNASHWFNTRQATYQAVTRAAHDGASEIVWLPLTEITDTRRPELPAATAQHCLDVDRARTATLTALQEGLSRIPAAPYVTDEGSPLTPTQVVSDTSGLYLVELSVVNPAALDCPGSDPDPAFPPGAAYPYQRPYVHLAVRLPMQATFGSTVVAPVYVVDATSAIDPAGGEGSP